MRRILTAVAVVLLSFLVGVTASVAFSEALDQATARYPGIVGSKLDDCSLCHVGSPGNGDLNSYGSDYETAGFNLAAVEGLDSDGDGFTNLQELNGLSFPGDASDTPDDGGGGGGGDDGEETIITRGTIGTYEELNALAVGSDDARDEALVAWIETIEDATAKADPTTMVRSRLIDDSGEPTKRSKKVVDLDGGDVDPEQGLSVAYGKKRFLAVWGGNEGMAHARLVKAAAGKSVKSVVDLEDASYPVAGWNDDKRMFLTAYAAPVGVGVEQVTTSGKVTRQPDASRQFRHLVVEIAKPLGFAAGDLATGQVLLGADGSLEPSRLAPRGVLLEDGDPTNIGDTLSGASRKEIEGAAAFNDDEVGIAVWRFAKKIFTAQLDPDGTGASKRAKLRGANAGAVALAPQSDGSFLVVWTDLKKKTLHAVGRSADGKTTTSALDLSAEDETVVPELLDAVRLGDDVLIVYAISAPELQIRSVIVGLR